MLHLRKNEKVLNTQSFVAMFIAQSSIDDGYEGGHGHRPISLVCEAVMNCSHRVKGEAREEKKRESEKKKKKLFTKFLRVHPQ